MRAVIQRVTKASVTINGKLHSQIEKGLLVLLGIEDSDSAEDIEWLSGKIVNLRIFGDENDVMNISVKDIDGDILIVSQFTLHASTKKGNRPSYIRASKPEIAIPLYEKMVKQLSNDLGKEIKTGVFAADMKVELFKDAQEVEFKNLAIPFIREKQFKIEFKGIILPHKYYADFIFFNSIIVEVKSAAFIVDNFIAQTINYLKASGIKLGIIANFGEKSFTYKRVVF